MKIFDYNIDFSFTDIDNLEKIKKAYEKILELEKEDISNLDFIELIKRECKIGKDFIDEVFGEGTSYKIFGEKNDYEKIMDAVSMVTDEFVEKQNKLNEKYSKYNLNRLERRNNKRRGKNEYYHR